MHLIIIMPTHFDGPLAEKTEAVKVKYLLFWSGEEGIEVSSTWDLSDIESNTLSVYWDRFGKYVAPKSNFRIARFKLRYMKQDNGESVKTCVKGEAANNIIHRTQRALMNVRIKEINFKIRTFKGLIADLNEELFTSLPSDMHTEVTNWVTHAHNAEWEKCRTRQQTKFARLIATHKPPTDRTRIPIVDVDEQETRDIKDRWVINKSDRTLNQHELSILQRGLNFAVSPTAQPVNDMITAIESACKIIGPDTEEATHLRSECVNILKRHKLPPSNITKEEREALQTLKKDSSVMILPADKGRATVILNTADYKTKCQDLLKDERTYKQLKKDPTNIYRTKLINLLK